MTISFIMAPKKIARKLMIKMLLFYSLIDRKSSKGRKGWLNRHSLSIMCPQNK